MNYFEIPTINQLKEKLEKDNKEFNDDYEMNEQSIIAWLDIVKSNLNFSKYLKDKGYEDTYLSIINFEEIYWYISSLLDNKEYDDIKLILQQLDVTYRESNEKIRIDINTGFFDILDEEIFSKISSFMPYFLIEIYTDLKNF